MSIQKHITILLLGIFAMSWSSEASAQFPKLFKKRNKAKNERKLKSEERWNYEIISNAASPEGMMVAKAVYDQNGAPQKLSLYSPNGQLKHQYFYKYDSQSLKRTRYWEYEEQQINDYVEEMDALGNVIKRIRYKATGEILDIKTWEFDSEGRPTLEVYYDDANQRIYEIRFSYNNAQRSATEKQHYLIEESSYMTAVELDDNFQPLSRSRYKEEGALVNKTVYLRDTDGRLTEVQHYPDGKTMSIREKYEYLDDRDKVIYSVFETKTSKMLEYSVFVYEYHK